MNTWPEACALPAPVPLDSKYCGCVMSAQGQVQCPPARGQRPPQEGFQMPATEEQAKGRENQAPYPFQSAARAPFYP